MTSGSDWDLQFWALATAGDDSEEEEQPVEAESISHTAVDDGYTVEEVFQTETSLEQPSTMKVSSGGSSAGADQHVSLACNIVSAVA